MRIAKNLSLDEETYAIAQEMQGDFSAFVRRMLRTPNVPELLQRLEELEAIAEARRNRIQLVEQYLIDVIVYGKTSVAREHLYLVGKIDAQGREMV
jgi:hypothetical protein